MELYVSYPVEVQADSMLASREVLWRLAMLGAEGIGELVRVDGSLVILPVHSWSGSHASASRLRSARH